MNDSDITRFWLKVDRSGGWDACWPWMARVAPNGYGHFWLDGTNIGAHRAAFFAAHGRFPEPSTPFACHSCDDRYPPADITYRRCCNPRHLYEGTQADNMRRMSVQNRVARVCGESRYWNTKLTEAQARALLAKRGTMSQTRAGNLFGVSQTHVGEIWRGEKWPHLKR